MNFIRYLCNGAGTGIILRAQAKPVNSDKTGTFAGRITQTDTTGKRSTRILDDVIEVITAAPEYAQKKVDFWSSRKIKSKVFGTGMFLTATGALIALSPTVLTTTSLGLVILGIGGAYLGLKRTLQASEQQEAWQQDPMANFQAQRSQIAESGFDYVFDNKLNGTVAHPKEVVDLWQEKAAKFLESFQDLCKSDKIKDFFTNNPLEADRLNYAYNNNVPQHLVELSNFYMLLKSIHHDREGEAAKISAALKMNVKTAALAPYREARDHFLKEAEAQKESKIGNLREEWTNKLKQVNDLRESEKADFKQGIKDENIVYHQKVIEVEIQHQKMSEEKKEKIQKFKDELNANLRAIQDKENLSFAKHSVQVKFENNAYHKNPVVMEANETYLKQYRDYHLMYNLAAASIESHFNDQMVAIEDWTKNQAKVINEWKDSVINEKLATAVTKLTQAYAKGISFQPSEKEDLYPNVELFIPTISFEASYDPAWAQHGITSDQWSAFNER